MYGHQQRKQITFRPLKIIDRDLLSSDISKTNFNLDAKNVDFIVDNNTVFTSLLDKHAPLKTVYVVHVYVCHLDISRLDNVAIMYVGIVAMMGVEGKKGGGE